MMPKRCAPGLERFAEARLFTRRERGDALDRRRARQDQRDLAKLLDARGELIGGLVEPLLDALALESADDVRGDADQNGALDDRAARDQNRGQRGEPLGERASAPTSW